MKKSQIPLSDEEKDKIYLFLEKNDAGYITRKNSKVKRCNSGNYSVRYTGSMIVIANDFSKIVSGTIPSKKVMPWELTKEDIEEILYEMPLSPLVESIEIKEKDPSTAEVNIVLKSEVKRVRIKPFNIKSTSKKETKHDICSKNVAVDVDEELKKEANAYFEKHYEGIKEFLKYVPEKLLKIPGFPYQGKKGAIKGYTLDTSYNVGSNGILYIQRGTLNYQYDLLKDETTVDNDPFKEYRLGVEKYLESWNEVSKFLEDGKEKHHWEVSVIPKNGTYRISAKYENFTKEFYLSAASYEQDIKNIKELLKTYEKEDKKAARDKIKAKKDRLKNTSLYGSILVDAICDLLLKNNGISITSIVANLRGTKTNNTFMKNGKYSGKFTLVPSSEIEKAVEELLNQGVIGSELIESKYNDYYVYKILDEESYRILVSSTSRKYENYTDIDWLEEIKKNDYGTNHVVEKLSIFEHPALYCVEPERVVKYLKTAPENVVEYAKTIQSVKSGATGRFLKDLLKKL